MRLFITISILFLTACKSQIDINNIEQRDHGLSYVKVTNQLVDGEVIRKFDNGSIASRENYKNGKPLGNWYAYGFDGEIVNYGFGVDTKKYQQKLSDLDLTYSFLSINIEGSFTFATFYLDNNNYFDEPKILLRLSKEVFNDYSGKYKIDDLLIFNKDHEYTVSKSATLNDSYRIDTVPDKHKKTVFIK